MNATKRSAARIGLVFCSALALAATGCVVHERTRTVYVQAPPPAVSVPPEPALEPPPPAPSPVVVIESESDFYEPLQTYGHWEVVGTYGRCWIPGRVEVGWRPYSKGCWQRTDAGWYWASEEPWGWATYHYGRWDFDTRFGWVWVPQTQWAPAWVAWREGGGYVGWAPLRPSVTIGVSIGAVHYEPAYASRAFVFVEHRRMLEPVRPKTVIVNNTTIINKTVNITKVNVVNKTVVNEGPRPEVIERASGRKVRPVPVHELRSKEETTVAARQRNIPTAASRRVQPPVRTESQVERSPAAAPRNSQVVEKAPVNDKPAELVAEPARPSAMRARPQSARIDPERPAHEEKKRDWETAKKATPLTVESAAKPEGRSERAVPAGRDFHQDEEKAGAGKPTPQSVKTNPVLDETRRNTPADEKDATAPASSELESKHDVRSETKREAKQTVKSENAPPTEERNHRPVKAEAKPGRAVPAGRDFHADEEKAVAAKPTSQPGTTSPVLDETRRNTPADKKGATAPASNGLESRHDVRSETKRETKQTVKSEGPLPADERTQRPQPPSKEKSGAAERAQANKKAKEAKEQKSNKGEEQEPTTPAPGSPRQPQ